MLVFHLEKVKKLPLFFERAEARSSQDVEEVYIGKEGPQRAKEGSGERI